MTMKKNFLIVDDDLSLRPIWEHLLFCHFVNFDMDWAIDCVSAEDFYLKTKKSSRRYDLIIIDMFLSGSETGLDFLNFLESQQEQSQILLVSSSDSNKLKSVTGDLKLKIDFLPKPFRITQIDKLLDSST